MTTIERAVNRRTRFIARLTFSLAAASLFVIAGSCRNEPPAPDPDPVPVDSPSPTVDATAQRPDDPERSAALVAVGDERLKSKAYASARVAFAEALKASPSNDIARSRLLRCGRGARLLRVELGVPLSCAEKVPGSDRVIVAGETGWTELNATTGEKTNTFSIKERIWAVAVSTSGRYVIAAGETPGMASRPIVIYDRIQKKATAQIIDDRSISTISITPDEQYALLGADELPPLRGDHMRLYRLADGGREWSANVNAQINYGRAFVSLDDGDVILARNAYVNALTRYSTATGQPIQGERPPLDGEIRRMTVSPDGFAVLIEYDDDRLGLLAPADGDIVVPFPGALSNVSAVCFVDEGRIAALGLSEGDTQVVNIKTGQTLAKIEGRSTAAVVAVIPLPSRTPGWTGLPRLLIVHTDGVVDIQLPGGSSDYAIETDGMLTAIAGAPFGSQFALGTLNPEPRLQIRRPDGRLVKEFSLPGSLSSTIVALGFTERADGLAVAFKNSTIAVFDGRTGGVVARGALPAGWDPRQLLSIDGGYLAFVCSPAAGAPSSAGGLGLFNVKDETLKTIASPNGIVSTVATFINDTQTFVIGGDKGVWTCSRDLRKAARETRLNAKTLSVSPSGALIAAVERHQIGFYDAQTLKPVLTSSIPNVSTRPVFSPDGRFIACVARRSLFVIRIATGHVVSDQPLASDAFGSPFWLDSGAKLGIASGTQHIRLYNMTTLFADADDLNALASRETRFRIDGLDVLSLSDTAVVPDPVSYIEPDIQKGLLDKRPSALLQAARLADVSIATGVKPLESFFRAAAFYRDLEDYSPTASISAEAIDFFNRSIERSIIGQLPRDALAGTLPILPRESDSTLASATAYIRSKLGAGADSVTVQRRQYIQVMADGFVTGEYFRSKNIRWRALSGYWLPTNPPGGLTGAAPSEKYAVAYRLLEPDETTRMVFQTDADVTALFGVSVSDWERTGYIFKTVGLRATLFKDGEPLIEKTLTAPIVGLKRRFTIELAEDALFVYLDDSTDPLMQYYLERPETPNTPFACGFAVARGVMTIDAIHFGD